MTHLRSLTRDEILSELTSSLEEMFDINPASVTMEARLREDLDLDSIDAIDLAVRLKKLIGRRVELSVLKELRTVSDVVLLIEKELRAASPGQTTPSEGTADVATGDTTGTTTKAAPSSEPPASSKTPGS